MAYKLWDYVDHRGNNAIKIWMEGLQKFERAKVNNKLDLLEKHGEELLPNLLTPVPRSRHLKEIVVSGKTALRLLLCRGPVHMGSERQSRHPAVDAQSKKEHEEAEQPKEFTLLLGAREKDRKYIPRDAVKKAEERRGIVLTDHSRRKDHERVDS